MQHPFQPILPRDARVLILGSFPSPASREKGFYYGHPRNAFWRILTQLTGKDFVHAAREEKIRLLYALRIALWDAFASARPEGSSDAKLREARLNDFTILPRTIRAIAYNGKTAARAYTVLSQLFPDAAHFVMPSTSPANTLPFGEKLRAWKRLCPYIPCAERDA